jgi:hypothetical protein
VGSCGRLQQLEESHRSSLAGVATACSAADADRARLIRLFEKVRQACCSAPTDRRSPLNGSFRSTVALHVSVQIDLRISSARLAELAQALIADGCIGGEPLARVVDSVVSPEAPSANAASERPKRAVRAAPPARRAEAQPRGISPPAAVTAASPSTAKAIARAKP